MIIKSEKENIRLDQFLSEELDLSRTKVQKLIKSDKVLVNNKKVMSSYKVSIDDEIEVLDDLDYSIDIKGEDIPLDIIYEDSHLLIINKKSGMVVHPAAGNYEHTLVNALVYHYHMDASNNLRPGIVHRLDKDTSGLMIVALDEKTLELLSNMMKEKQVERKYLAIVEGVIPHDTGTIDAPIGRDLHNRQKMAVTDINSKNAITHFRVLKRFSNNTLIECKLETGRTHQIRVHMAYIGYPVCNDPVYGKKKNTTSFGQMLHSYYIKFKHPISGKVLEYTQDAPKEFEEYLEKLEQEDTL